MTDDALCERLEEAAQAIGWRASLYEIHKHPMPNTAKGLRDHEQTVRAAIAAIRRARAKLNILRSALVDLSEPMFRDKAGRTVRDFAYDALADAGLERRRPLATAPAAEGEK